MAFKLEKDMAISISQDYNKLLHSIYKSQERNAFFVGNEISFSYRIIDLVYVIYNSEKNLKLYEFNNLSFLDTDILAMLYCNARTSKYRLAETLYIDIEILENSLTKLAKNKLIDKVSVNSYSLNKKFKECIPDKFISLELKLSNWREALDQAVYNKKFSDESYVIIDKDKIPKNIKFKNFYQTNNIGLITCDNNNNYEVIVKPKKNKNIHKYSNVLQKIRFIKDCYNKKKWGSFY
ncbi:MAG: hypothetical protein ACRC1T_17440 [Clostridium chrysemydis]|uniref:hypothetical protein n=1 Tax=Clostridium chrysemydis TaxID=2665504 RepID=UPI003F2A0307